MFRTYYDNYEGEGDSQEETDLIECFRSLWEQHVYWTRMVIMGIVFDLPDLKQTTNRLLCNAPDFARVFGHFYGTEVASEFEQLLKDHLVIAAELVKAAKADDSKAAADAEKRWYANADEIVCFLKHINQYWSGKQMQAMWYEHLALTKEEAVAMLKKNYTKSIKIFNKIERAALMMADTFSCGLYSSLDDEAASSYYYQPE